jgi:FlaA1/EpsC-like NDP-sugar epimerase
MPASEARRRGATTLMISTDKAVNAPSIMGTSKRLAELVLLTVGGSTTRMASIRPGKFPASKGSLVPQFAEQIARGAPVTVTHAKAEPYFLTMDETKNRIFRAAAIVLLTTASGFTGWENRSPARICRKWSWHAGPPNCARPSVT